MKCKLHLETKLLPVLNHLGLPEYKQCSKYADTIFQQTVFSIKILFPTGNFFRLEVVNNVILRA